MAARVASALLSLALAACAGHGGDAPPPMRGYFISPNGEPFSFDAGQSGVARWFDAADSDNDGAVSPAEFRADGERFFAAADADADGLVTAPEVSALRARLAPQLEAMLAYLPAPGGRPPRPEQRLPRWTPEQGFITARRGARTELLTVVTLLNEREPVLASDADFNRRVTREEFAAAAAERFALLDADHSGALTLPELEALRR